MKPRVTSFSALQIARTINGTLLGKGEDTVRGLTSISAPIEGHLAFLRGKSKTSALRVLSGLSEMVVLVNEALLPEPGERETLRCSLIVVEDPQRAFLNCIPLFYEEECVQRVVHPTAIIDPSARLGANVAIGPYSVVGPNTIIGDNVTLHAHVTLYRDVTIGDGCELHSGVVIREGCVIGHSCCLHNHAVIGGDGFGYLSDPSRGITKVPQVGIVRVGNCVEIGVGSAIDRAAIGATTIGDHTKIDNHVQIGHNVVVGSHCVICAKAGIGGSSVLGNGVVVGGGAGIADHLTIASGVRLGGHAGATGSIDTPGDYMGFPAVPAQTYRRERALLRRILKRGTDAQ